MDRIYLDYAATTPLDPRVLETMLPYFSEDFGNPSSNHYFGQKAEAGVEKARQVVGKYLGVTPDEVFFTSGGSESDNLALRGVAFARRKKFNADTILISPVEHHAVSLTARQLEKEFGFKLLELRVDSYGKVIIEDLQEKISDKVAIVSVVYANNEIGTINAIAEIGKICESKGVPFHSDTVQACAHLNVDAIIEKIGLLSLSGHKFYGPKGVGVLISKKGIDLLPQSTGGKQEHNLRAGTHNVPGIVGLARALEIANLEREKNNAFLVQLRDKLIKGILENISGSQLTGHPTDRLPNHASFVIERINGNDLVILLDMAGFACSSGSACKVGDPKPSDILLAINLPLELAIGSLRVTLGWQTTEKHIDRFLEVLPGIVLKLRK